MRARVPVVAATGKLDNPSVAGNLLVSLNATQTPFNQHSVYKNVMPDAAEPDSPLGSVQEG
jgi:hypothetical protein